MKRKLFLITVALIGIAVFAGWWFLLKDDSPPPPDLESAIQIASTAQMATTTTNSATVPSTTFTPTSTTKAPATIAPTSTTETPTTIAPTSTTQELDPNEETDIAGIWSVDTTIGSFGIDESTSSFVGFRIQEVLARGIGEVTAVGRTPLVDGTLNFVEGSLTKAEIIADLTELRTDRSMRDSKVQSALNTSTHPNAVFVLDETITLNNSKIIFPVDGT